MFFVHRDCHCVSTGVQWLRALRTGHTVACMSECALHDTDGNKFFMKCVCTCSHRASHHSFTPRFCASLQQLDR